VPFTYAAHCPDAAWLALTKLVACTCPTHWVPSPVPKHEHRNSDCAGANAADDTTTGAGLSTGNAEVVANAAGAPGAAAGGVTGTTAGADSAGRFATDAPDEPPELSGITTGAGLSWACALGLCEPKQIVIATKVASAIEISFRDRRSCFSASFIKMTIAYRWVRDIANRLGYNPDPIRTVQALE